MASLEPGLGIGLLAVSGIAGIGILFEFELTGGFNAGLPESFGIGAHVGVTCLPVHGEVAEVPVTFVVFTTAQTYQASEVRSEPLILFGLAQSPRLYVMNRDIFIAATRRARRVRFAVGVPRLGPSVPPGRGCAVGQGVSTRLVLPRLAIGFRLSLVDGKGRGR